MDNRKQIEKIGPFAGLWVRTARALKRAGYATKEQVRADLNSGKLRAFISGVKDYGLYAHEETCIWATQSDTATGGENIAAVYQAQIARRRRFERSK